MKILIERYGIDFMLHREINASCPTYKKFIVDAYYINFEEVRLLVMKNLDEPKDGIEIL